MRGGERLGEREVGVRWEIERVYLVYPVRMSEGEREGQRDVRRECG